MTKKIYENEIINYIRNNKDTRLANQALYVNINFNKFDPIPILNKYFKEVSLDNDLCIVKGFKNITTINIANQSLLKNIING
jgi:hypothetical protein